MSIESIFSVSRSGLDVERARLEQAARDIAASNTPLNPGAPNVAGSGFSAAIGGSPAERVVRDPSNPMADANGMVHYPKVDLVEEMSTLVAASRGYEANLRAFNALHSMLFSALDIGRSQG
jgi:flagellar basal-body rod protein FlgC